MNEEKANYLQLDIYLLPNQMLPEHYHLATDKCAPKMEGWLCRHGRSYVYGEGPKTEDMHAKIPKLQRKWVTVFHETVIDPGQSAHLNRPTARHWQFAGPQGAILTEVGTFHDGDGVRHTDPNIVF
jgi:D-lyxose ketol-isomerase